ncbi:MAG: hypothetical protein ABR905_05490 [Terracidiphilus sp.]
MVANLNKQQGKIQMLAAAQSHEAFGPQPSAAPPLPGPQENN